MTPPPWCGALAAYPLNCLEQLTSRGFPLAMLTQGSAGGPDRAGQLQTATEAVLDRQRFDGAFGLWSSTDDAQPWLTAYATDFLLRGAPCRCRCAAQRHHPGFGLADERGCHTTAEPGG